LQSIQRDQASQIVFHDWPLTMTDFKPQALGVSHHDRDIVRPVRQGSKAQQVGPSGEPGDLPGQGGNGAGLSAADIDGACHSGAGQCGQRPGDKPDA